MLLRVSVGYFLQKVTASSALWYYSTLAKRQAVDLWPRTKALSEIVSCIRMINVTIFAVHHLVKKEEETNGKCKECKKSDSLRLLRFFTFFTQCLLFSLLSCKTLMHSAALNHRF
uniref:Uncharacterized protein n=1 Tax=Chelydra serpentina TaxID=8475 RepID=A0A8C3SAU2_CHESE